MEGSERKAHRPPAKASTGKGKAPPSQGGASQSWVRPMYLSARGPRVGTRGERPVSEENRAVTRESCVNFERQEIGSGQRRPKKSPADCTRRGFGTLAPRDLSP
jgi:hypothetical protein